MKNKMRVMSERPLNAETPVESLRTWVTDNRHFFKRNQGKIMDSPVDIHSWTLAVEGLVEKPLRFSFADLLKWRSRTCHPCPGHRMNRRNALRLGLFGILYIDYSS